MGVVGTNVPRKEDRRLVTGRGTYVGDITLPRMRHVAFVRSPVAHARITSVDVSGVGDARVFTGQHPAFRSVELRAQSALDSYVETAQPILAYEKVRYMGEPIAMAIGISRYDAEDVAELVGLETEELRPTVCAWGEVVDPVHVEASDNVLLERTFDTGDIDGAISAADLVVERTVTTNRHAANPMECRAGIALWNYAEQSLTFWSSTQVPHIVRNILAELLEIPEGKVRVIAPDVGGGFGVKSLLYAEDVALCIAARLMPDTPLKWVEDRSEHLQAAAHAREHRYVMRAGFDSDGKLLALDADITANTGAYSVYPWTAGIEPLMAGGLLSGPYRLDQYRATVRGVATNTAPAGPYRGVARPAAVYAMETLLDEAAHQLGLDPIELRRRNLIRRSDVPYRMPSRLVDESGHYLECLEQALELLEYDHWRAEQRRRQETGENPIGIGIACYNELTGLGRAASAGPRMPFRTGHDACTVRVNPDGTVTVLSGVTSQGQALQTTMAQVVADALGVSYADVDVRIGDTAESLWGFGAFSSRQAVIGGGAAHRTAVVVREHALRLAAALGEIDVADLELRDGLFVAKGDPTPILTLGEVARVAYLESNRLPEGFEPGLEATRFYDPIRGAFAAGVQLGVLEVDRSSGLLQVLRWVCVEDTGAVIHPKVVEGQVLGAIAQGIGGALYEHLVYDEQGNLITGSLMDYLMPTSAEVPELVLGHVSQPADNPTGVRGVGEGGTLGPNAVIAGAVREALGIAVDALPITPSSVWQESR